VSDDGAEIVPVGKPGLRRQHRAYGRIRPTASPGPCGAVRRGWPGLRGCASATESRERANDGGCSAETCAYPWPLLGSPDFRLTAIDCAHAVVSSERIRKTA
jgi:hypothetical protein